MNQEQLSRILLAFGHLDRFSVPGIGTFRKEKVASRVDGVNKRVLPPAERFVLEPGEHHVSSLTEFLFRHLQVNHSTAESIVRELGTAMQNHTEREGQTHLPGVGLLSRDRLYGFQLQAADLDVPEFFGLGEIQIKTQQVPERKVSATEKQKVIVDHLEQNTVRVEPAPPPARRRRSALPWVLIVLLVGGITAGFVFWPQIKDKMIAMGWIKGGRQIASISDNPRTDAGDSAATQTPIDTAGHQSSSSAQIETGNDAGDTRTTNPKPTKQTSEVRTSSEIKDLTVPAVRGTHYLVVASSFQKYDALSISQTLSKKKYAVKVIRPSRDGFYRVTVFSSKDKMQVIQKMVEWKNDFPEKSYIFSN